MSPERLTTAHGPAVVDVLGIRNEHHGELLAVATVTPPDSGPSPEAPDGLREELWRQVGSGARSRSETFGYRRVGHARVSHQLETLGFFRPSAQPSAG